MVDNLTDITGSTLQHELSLVKPLISLFANRPTRLIRDDWSAKSPVQTMLNLSDYVGTHRNPSDLMAVKGTISTSIFQKL
jgi:hypothetical protein